MSTEVVNSSDSDDGGLAALLEEELNRSNSTSASDNSDNGPEEENNTRSVYLNAKRQRIDENQTASTSAVCPPHPGYIGGLCIRCGGKRTENAEQGVALRYIHRGLEISHNEADRIRQESLLRTLTKQKLFLVLDLDHTILNSTRIQDLNDDEERKLFACLEAQQQAEFKELHHLPLMRLWTKLRPYVKEFLEEAHQYFELHIYTMGDRDYAQAMSRLLDPDQKFFQGRIVSQNDSTQRYLKDLDVILGADHAVMILDDTEAVWPKHRANLLQMDRYLFFPACAERFGAGSKSLLENDTDEDATTGALATTLKVLKEVHTSFFDDLQSQPLLERDVRGILRARKRRVLEGVEIVFSRVFPMHLANPHLHPLWALAEEYGAKCSTSLEESTTHVVAVSDGTDKVRSAYAHKKHVVLPDWIYCSAFTWKRADEALFNLRPPTHKPNKTEQLTTIAETEPTLEQEQPSAKGDTPAEQLFSHPKAGSADEQESPQPHGTVVCPVAEPQTATL